MASSNINSIIIGFYYLVQVFAHERNSSKRRIQLKFTFCLLKCAAFQDSYRNRSVCFGYLIEFIQQHLVSAARNIWTSISRHSHCKTTKIVHSHCKTLKLNFNDRFDSSTKLFVYSILKVSSFWWKQCFWKAMNLSTLSEHNSSKRNLTIFEMMNDQCCCSLSNDLTLLREKMEKKWRTVVD